MDLIVIFGPPAVGKMAVGEELCRRTGFKLLHNHLMMEPLLTLFPYGSPPFTRLAGEFRWRVFDEAAAADLPGMVFTYVWDLEHPGDATFLSTYTEAAGTTTFVELTAGLETRLHRNTTELRLQRKPSKRDLEASRANLLHLDRHYTMTTDAGRSCTEARALLDRHRYLKLDNTHLTPAAVVTRVLAAGDPPA